MIKGKIDAEVVFNKLEKYDDAVRFLIKQIERIQSRGGKLNMKRADKYLRPLGIIVKEDYFKK